jgi:O-antigen ligase
MAIDSRLARQSALHESAQRAPVAGVGAFRLLRFCLFSAILFSTATQLRFGPIGVGEVFGFLAIALTLSVNLHRIEENAKVVLMCFFVLWLSVCCGALLSTALGGSQLLARDLIALIYAQLIAWCVLAAVAHDGRVLRVVLWALILFPLAQALSVVLGVFTGFLDVWYGGDDGEAGIPFLNRFMGWSINPNQLGIALSALPFWILYFFKSSPGVMSRLVALISLIISFGVAALVQSNTVFFAWVMGASFALLVVYRKYFLAQPVIVAFSILAFFFTATFFIDDLGALLSKGEFDDYNGRSPLWTSALLAFSKSPIFGLGPGAHADEGDGRGGFEAHSLALDLATQGGLVAVLVLLFVAAKSFRVAFNFGSPLVLGGFVATTIECLAHNTQRHPMFWLYLLLPLIVVSAHRRI